MWSKRTLVLTSLLLIGISMLLNPVYLSPENPDGEGTEITYEVDEVETDGEAKQALYEAEATLLCGVGAERSCALEREIVAQGSVEFDGTFPEQRADADDAGYRQNARYELVQFEDGFYVPETDRTGNTTLLTLREVSRTDALEHIAVSSDNTSSDVRNAIETGSVRIVDERISVLEQGRPIEHEGDIYYVDVVESDNTVDYDLLFVRLLLFVTGTILIAFAWINRTT